MLSNLMLSVHRVIVVSQYSSPKHSICFLRVFTSLCNLILRHWLVCVRLHDGKSGCGRGRNSLFWQEKRVKPRQMIRAPLRYVFIISIAEVIHSH